MKSINIQKREKYNFFNFIIRKSNILIYIMSSIIDETTELRKQNPENMVVNLDSKYISIK
jgi:hypothetical protein